MGLSKPARKILRVLARRGAPEVLLSLSRGSARFTDLQAELRLSPRTLVERLKDLALLGLVERRAYPEVPPRVEYTLTPKGRDLLHFLERLEIELTPMDPMEDVR